MSGLLGTWALTMRTPIGSIEAEISFTGDGDAIAGRATSKAEAVVLHNIVVVPDGVSERVTWTQAITKPMRLNLAFEVVVEGDCMQGYSRAGRLPRSAVTGERR